MEITRRHFFSRTSTGIGIAALGSLLAEDGFAAAMREGDQRRSAVSRRQLPALIDNSAEGGAAKPRLVAIDHGANTLPGKYWRSSANTSRASKCSAVVCS